MLKDRKHIKQSKGQRLHWANVAAEKDTIVYRVALDSRFLQSVRISEKQNSTVSLRNEHKLLVP